MQKRKYKRSGKKKAAKLKREQAGTKKKRGGGIGGFGVSFFDIFHR